MKNIFLKIRNNYLKDITGIELSEHSHFRNPSYFWFSFHIVCEYW